MKLPYNRIETQEAIYAKHNLENLYYEQDTQSLIQRAKYDPKVKKVFDDAATLTDEYLSEAKQMYSEGKSLKEIEEYFEPKTSITWWIIKKLKES